MTSRSKAVRAVITDRQQFMKHVTIVRQDAREQSVIKISHQISHSRTTTSTLNRCRACAAINLPKLGFCHIYYLVSDITSY